MNNEVDVASSACIIKLAEIVLTHNYFMFLNDYFIQMKGTAMGSPMAPNYAHLYVGYMKKQSCQSSLFKFFCLPNIIIQKQYIDIFVLWRGMQNSSRRSILFLTLVMST